jgi:putative transposase
MARAKRHYIAGQIWHITHRCHKKEFLLKFSKDRRRYLQWLWEAKKRYGLVILNYMVTSNHVHLLVADDGDRTTIPRSIQLVAGRTGQEYNQRKDRKGAFWQDRYHATAVETGRHFLQCLVYIDLNMVRAGVIAHPIEWIFGGYGEIQKPRRKCALIAYERLYKLSGFDSYDQFTDTYRKWVASFLENGDFDCDRKWTQSIAIGSEKFVKDTKQALGIRAKGRKVVETGEAYQLRDPQVSYPSSFYHENDDIGPKNTYFWDVY